MQNLSLPVTQTAPIKNMSDATNKNDAGPDKSATAEPGNSFQNVLSRQVQAKQAQEKQASASQNIAKQTATKQAAANPAPAKSAAESAQAATEQAGNAKADAAVDGDKKTELADPAKSLDAKSSDAVDPKTLVAVKEDADTKPEAAVITAVDPNVIALAPVVAAPVLNVGQSTQDTAASAEAKLASSAEAASPQQKSLDTVLSNALSQGRNSNAVDKDAVDIQDSKAASEHSRWLDVMLPNAARQKSGDESASAMLSAIKDSGSKDAATPISFQTPAQINATQINAAAQLQEVGRSNTINAYPGKTGWDQAISQKVMWMVGAGEQSASLTLNPPDMGPLQVVIHVHNDQADTTFISDNAEVRQALQDGMANLRDKMNESGIQLGQANVSSGGQSQQAFQQAAQSRMAAQANNNGAPVVADKVGTANTMVRVANGLVDTFA